MQKSEAGDPTPGFFADIWKLRRVSGSGSVNSTFVGPAGAGTQFQTFTVPRDGIYIIEASIFQLAGTVLTWQFMEEWKGGIVAATRVVTTSAGFKLGGIYYCNEGDRFLWNNIDAMAGGDVTVANLINYELAAG